VSIDICDRHPALTVSAMASAQLASNEISNLAANVEGVGKAHGAPSTEKRSNNKGHQGKTRTHAVKIHGDHWYAR
jgi:hypothetical protein